MTLAVIGTGPRGISVLERLAVLLAEEKSILPVRICAIDDVEVGAGRIWRTDQDSWYTMNTVASQITMYSGEPDGGPWRPGAGPSLEEWSRQQPGREPLGPNSYASRQTYGHYLRSVYQSIADHLPPHVELVGVRARVSSLVARPTGGWLLELDGSAHPVAADQVLLATGHPKNTPDMFERRMTEFAEHQSGNIRYLCGDSAADMDLGAQVIPAGSTIGIRGLGLSFYDVMLSLTVGRGGAFKRTAEGTLSYLASGHEPHIVAGSRSGLPIPARGVNQKGPGHTYRPRFFTREAIARARERRIRATGSGQLSFADDVLPLLVREVEQVYRDMHETRDAYGTPPALDLHRLARPFTGMRFAGPHSFRSHLLQVMRADLAEAALGNARGPLKAALDVLRDVRDVIRDAVDYGGLLPQSHEEEFADDFLPVIALLSAGPPVERVEQLVALIEAGVVEIVGPSSEFTTDDATGLFRISSPQVEGSSRYATALIDARIPTPDLYRDTSGLTQSLLTGGVVSEYVRLGPDTSPPVSTGGLNVTRAPFRVIATDGRVHEDLYALGIPTEHTRWFTQVGSGTPGVDTLFVRDADAVAKAMLRPPGDDTGARHMVSTAGSMA